MGAVISAFWFTVDPLILFLFWAVAALVVSVATSFWRAKGTLILLVPALALMLWWLPEIVEGGKWMVHFISSEYSQWLFVPVLFPGAAASEYEQTLFFAFFGVFLSVLLSVSICLRRSAFLTILFTVPIVFLTFVIIFNQADSIFLAGLLAVYLALLFSGAVFPDSFRKRGLAVFPALAAALLLMGAAYITAPPDRYNREDFVNSIDFYFRNFAARTGIMRIKGGVGWPSIFNDAWSFNTDNVAIAEAGTREIMNYGLLEVVSSHAGSFYLRGYAMEHFNGSRWINNTDGILSQDDFLALSVPAVIAGVYGSSDPGNAVSIVSMTLERTGDASKGINYFPYYTYPSTWGAPDQFAFYYVRDGIISLYETIPPEDLPAVSISSQLGLEAYGEHVQSRETYLQIRGSTAEGLRRIAQEAGIDSGASREKIAEQVAEFFSSFGRYTLTPLTAPEDEDFALYFLQTSRQGYCIHYATAATLMLRALGVPARFTSGFVVSVSHNEVNLPVVLTDGNAHSWVEVYFNEYGWLPFEVTPPSDGFGAPDGRPLPVPGYTPPGFDAYDPDWPDDNRNEPGALQPGGTGAPGQPVADDPSDRSGLPLAALIAIAVVAALFIRVLLARLYRKKSFAQADTNAAIISAWRYISRLNRGYRSDQPPKPIEELALKARFSQHTMTEAERSRVVVYAQTVSADAYGKASLLRKLWVRCILGL